MRRALVMGAAAALLAAGAATGTARVATSAAAPAASVTVVGSATTVRPQDAPAGSASAGLVAARNEFESFQVVVRAGASSVTGVAVSLAAPLSGPRGSIPPSNVRIYREAYLDVAKRSDLEGDTGLWPDALIPAVDPIYGEARDAFPLDVPAGENRVAWVDVLVPPDLPPGRYDGELLVTGDGGLLVTVPVHLTVLKFALPATATLRSAFGMEWDGGCPAHYGNDCIHDEEEGWALKSLYVRAALENRMTISYSEYQPPVAGDEAGWFRQYILPMLRGDSPQNDAGEWLPVRLPGARLTSIQVDSDYLGAWRRRAEEGRFVRRAFLYACDEPNRDAGAWRGCKRSARDARPRWPKLRVLVTASIQDAEDFGATDLIDILVPIVNELHDKPGSRYSGNQRPEYRRFLRDGRNNLWAYHSCMSHGCTGDPVNDPYLVGWPSYAIDQPASEHRAMGWLAFEYRFTGELYWATDWDLAAAWTDQFSFGGNGDGTLFYPGKPSVIGGTHDIPLDSIRMKRIRDGYEDYEYLHFLEDNGMRSEAVAVARGLFPTAYRTDVSQAELDAARNEIGALVAGLTGGPVP